MSAFNFINNNNTSSPSPSLLDDLYESQEFHSFVNQGSWHNSNSSKYNNSNSITLSPKPALKSSTPSTSRLQSPSPNLKSSAFGFINQSSSSLLEPTDLVFSNSNILTKSVSVKASPQVKLSSVSSHWTRLGSDRLHDIQTLQRLYEKRTKVYEQINQLIDSIQLTNQQKDTALANEDYAVAERMHVNQEKMNTSLVDLQTNVIEQLNLKIQKSWHILHRITKKETGCADDMIEQCQIVKNERQHQLVKFEIDNERIQENKLHGLQNRRDKVETDKSEVAFDFGIWEQSDTDLRERMDEAIQEEKDKKADLSSQAESLQTEIEQLLKKVEQLTNKKKKALQDLDHVESVINEKLRPFTEEKQEHDKEYEVIQQKKEDIDQKTIQLDEEEIRLHKQIELYQDEKERGWEELNSYDKKMEGAVKRKEEGQVELETIEKITNIIEKRDEHIVKQQSEIIKSRAALLRQNEETNKLKKEMISEKQKEVEQIELISQMENKLSSIRRYKTLAVESGQFQNANKLNEQIKNMEKELINTKQVNNNNKIDDSTTDWEDAKNKLEKMKSDHEDLEHQLETERKTILGKAKEEIQLIYDNINTSGLLKSILEYELNTLDQ